MCWLGAFAEGLRGRSTARLQEMRRLLDGELARRMQPSEDLRDERAVEETVRVRGEIRRITDFTEARVGG